MKVLIFTEGGNGIGLGHIMRCMAICEAFKEKNVMSKFIVNADSSVKDALKFKGYKIMNWFKGPCAENLARGADIAIIDSYLANLDFYKRISKTAKLCAYLDDNKRIDYPKGIVINGSLAAGRLSYPKRKGVVYLLGTEYTPLRKAFWDIPKKSIRKKAQDIMITFGGDDARGMTLKVLKRLVDDFPGLHKKVIISSGFKNADVISNGKYKNTSFKYNLSARKMLKAMLDSDIAVSAGGQTLYELAKVGVPTVAVGVADNQLHNIKYWDKAGFVEYAGCGRDASVLDKISKGVEKFLPYKQRELSSKNGNRLMNFVGPRNIFDELISQL
ncbi:MAG: UDP-2,4-diacetamido-2,4,6-trideoxy-beta-L-altropyranose hydrolase [Candidatus Omnitrophica bacterium CG_4_8_14_3_um_filter_43_15]|nr:MAG: UDP-2,4-diacetamido-2,4,6-trideoxy-beta-L-altropyranose hydrolase [Candidatus Omnitrophica bacterium CG_4_8_14_3_um_filter_43_15]